MKKAVSIASLMLVLGFVAGSAQAFDVGPVIGGGVGAVAGAVIGDQVGGRGGAIIGSGVGGAVGAVIGQQVYAAPVVYGPPRPVYYGYSPVYSVPVRPYYRPGYHHHHHGGWEHEDRGYRRW